MIEGVVSEMIAVGVAVLATALALAFGTSLVARRLIIVAPLLIAAAVVLIGYAIGESFAPTWVAFAAPFPVGLVLLWLVLGRSVRKVLVAYLLTWLMYGMLHVLLSGLFGYHSLIPVWQVGGS